MTGVVFMHKDWFITMRAASHDPCVTAEAFLIKSRSLQKHAHLQFGQDWQLFHCLLRRQDCVLADCTHMFPPAALLSGSQPRRPSLVFWAFQIACWAVGLLAIVVSPKRRHRTCSQQNIIRPMFRVSLEPKVMPVILLGH